MRFMSQFRSGVRPLPVCYFGHPTLREKVTDIPQVTDEIRNFAERMLVTMDKEDGIGLAAPQVGRSINMVAFAIPQPEPGDENELPSYGSPGEALLLPRMPLVLINLKLSAFSPDQAPYNEGCLSIPDLRAPVVRSLMVNLEAETLDGEKLNIPCGGLLARCLMHEVDHLNGILFTDLISDEDKEKLQPELNKMKRQTLASLKKRNVRA